MNSKFLFAIAGGLVAGTVLGMLFAPAKGEETRESISKTVKKVRDDINEKVETSNRAITEIREQMKDLNAKLKKTMVAS